jgi:hypothetical protein
MSQSQEKYIQEVVVQTTADIFSENNEVTKLSDLEAVETEIISFTYVL